MPMSGVIVDLAIYSVGAMVFFVLYTWNRIVGIKSITERIFLTYIQVNITGNSMDLMIVMGISGQRWKPDITSIRQSHVWYNKTTLPAFLTIIGEFQFQNLIFKVCHTSSQRLFRTTNICLWIRSSERDQSTYFTSVTSQRSLVVVCVVIESIAITDHCRNVRERVLIN